MKRAPPACFLAFALLATASPGFSAETRSVRQSVDFHDIHRDGAVAVIGHFGIPIGQLVRVEGRLAKPSKVSNESTLEFSRINGARFEDPRWSAQVQISNVDALPTGVDIVVEGYEYLVWRGTPEINWHTEVDFVVTKVIAPDSLKVKPGAQ